MPRRNLQPVILLSCLALALQPSQTIGILEVCRQRCRTEALQSATPDCSAEPFLHSQAGLPPTCRVDKCLRACLIIQEAMAFPCGRFRWRCGELACSSSTRWTRSWHDILMTACCEVLLQALTSDSWIHRLLKMWLHLQAMWRLAPAACLHLIARYSRVAAIRLLSSSVHGQSLAACLPAAHFKVLHRLESPDQPSASLTRIAFQAG